ncbi:MAG: hypothetical protein JWM56_778 [Candidatus Peribacteria bacterium]|nr:hypothetical protein [Candidatus Peribacteria bacterium]
MWFMQLSSKFRFYWPLILCVAILMAILIAFLAPYSGNSTALFHMDIPTAATQPLPKPFIVLRVPGYDGMHYYRIARRIPLLFTQAGREELSHSSTFAYAYQRFSLPFLAYILALGMPAALPFSFLFIQLVSLLGTCWLLLYYRCPPLYALALALSPAAILGLHFSLAEPLTLFLLTAFLLRYLSRVSIDWLQVLLLSLLVLTREVNIFLVIFLLVFTVLKKNRSRPLLLLVPFGVFLVWHFVIYAIFHEIPFLWSVDKRAFPLSAILGILVHPEGYNYKTITSIAVFFAFFLPALCLLSYDFFRRPRLDLLLLGSLFFLAIMSTMPDYIWGSVTSIGRVITPVYPFTILYAAQRNDWAAKGLAVGILCLGLFTALGLSLVVHPFTVF